MSLRNTFKSFTGLGASYLNAVISYNGTVVWNPYQVNVLIHNSHVDTFTILFILYPAAKFSQILTGNFKSTVHFRLHYDKLAYFTFSFTF